MTVEAKHHNDYEGPLELPDDKLSGFIDGSAEKIEALVIKASNLLQKIKSRFSPNS